MPSLRSLAGILGTLTVALTLAACDYPPGAGGDLHRRTARHVYERDISAVHVDVSAGSIRVEGGERRSVAVERTARWTGPKPRIEQRVEGTTLVIEARCPDAPSSDRCEVSYDIRVPADTNVRAETGAGDVRAAGVAGRAVLRAGAGEVAGTALRSRRVEASTSAGGVELSFTEPPQRVRAVSEAGDVTVLVPGPRTYRVVARTSVGSVDVDVRTDPDAPRVVRARTSAGSVHVAYRG